MSKQLNNRYLCLIETELIDFEHYNYYLSESSLSSENETLLRDEVITKEFWNKNLDVKNHKKLTKKIYDSVILSLTEALNKNHKENHENLYWERIIGVWTWFYISNYLEKYTRLQHVYDTKPDFMAIGINPKKVKPLNASIDYLDSIRNAEITHLQQYSFILGDLFKNNFKTVEFKPYRDLNISFKKPYNFKNIILFIIQKFIGTGYTSGDYVLFATRFSNKNLIKLFFRSRFKIRPIYKKWYKTNTYLLNKETRKKLVLNNFGKQDCIITKSILKNIVYSIPLEFIEGYKEIKKDVDQQIKKNLPKKIITGIGFTLDTKFAIWAASCSEEGSIIYGCQHGGLYGDTNIIADEYFERKLTDHYISWGWDDDGSINKLPSQIFSDRIITKRDPKKLLWVMTLDSRYSYHIEEMLVGERFYKYFENQKIFFKNLSPNARKDLLIRRYPSDFDWNIREKLDYCEENLVDISKSSFEDNLKQSKLVVIDHIGGTTALECASSSIPFIIISDKRDSNFRDSSKAIHEKLLEANILFHDYGKAAKYIDSIMDDIEGWWNDEIRQNVLNKYRNTYVRTKKDFLKEWNDFLLK